MSCVPNICIFKGDTPKFEFTIEDSNCKPVNLTDGEVTFCAKTSFEDSGYIFNKVCTITDAAQGKCEVRLTSEDTAIIVQDAIAELGLEFPTDGVILTLEQFNLEIKPDIRV